MIYSLLSRHYLLLPALYAQRSTQVLPATLCTQRSTLYALRSTLYALRFTLYSLSTTCYPLHSIPARNALHCTIYHLSSTSNSLRSTLYVPRSALYAHVLVRYWYCNLQFSFNNTGIFNLQFCIEFSLYQLLSRFKRCEYLFKVNILKQKPNH